MKGSVNKFYGNFYNYIFPSEQVYFSELRDAQICGMQEQTIAYSTQTALCMHRGWVGITFASTVLSFPEYLHCFPRCISIHMDRKALTGTTYYPFCKSHKGINSIGNTTFAYMAGLESLQLS